MNSSQKQKNKKNYKKGSTLFIALTVSTVVLVLAMSILSIITKELRLSFLARQSQVALTAADAGVECALYWDLVHPGFPSSYFATSSDSAAVSVGVDPTNNFGVPANNDFCAGQTYNPATFAGNTWAIDDDATAATTTFTFSTWSADFSTPSDDNPCTSVSMSKYLRIINGFPVIHTKIRAEGYNNCDLGNARRVSRGIEINY